MPDRSRQGSAQQPPAGAEAARPGDGGTTLAAFTVDGGALRSGRRASKLIGSTVYNENNESVGEVDDILIVPGGAGPVAVVSVGGFLGIGAKLVAVPYDRLQPAGGGNNRWTLTGATKESLGSLPTFTYGSTGERKG
ncbi:PRC-barrel domain-containing protein [Paracraurococcus ruber]|uniref:PRC-barrel domain-containing protein n=1 Tax=Paracraurococcus ruber TaxID=77675 RepID=UPI001904E72F